MTDKEEKKQETSEDAQVQSDNAPPKYEPPKIQKFEKLEKLILSGE